VANKRKDHRRRIHKVHGADLSGESNEKKMDCPNFHNGSTVVAQLFHSMGLYGA
jgi:hypothetical protein